MSARTEKPVLQGQRIKTRKRDEKVKWDPVAFRDNILRGIIDSGSDLEGLQKFLVSAGSKLDYKHYGETLFDILIAGGILAPGGSLLEEADDGKPFKTTVCLFESDYDVTSLTKWAQFFMNLMRRYKYLEKMFAEEIGKIMSFMHGFSETNKIRLARIMVLWLSDGVLPPSIISSILKEHLIKDMVAANFIAEFFLTWLTVKDLNSLKAMLKKGALETRLMEFLPRSKQTDAFFEDFFNSKGLDAVVVYQKQQTSKAARRNLQTNITQMLQNGDSIDAVVSHIRELNSSLSMSDADLIGILWPTVMSQVEWSKKDDLITDQALRHLLEYKMLFKAFSETSPKAQLILINRMQDYCYDNMNLTKSFSKMVILFYKHEIIIEEVILRWYIDLQSGKPKGKTVFLEQIKPFVEWLKNAEEEEEDDE